MASMYRCEVKWPISRGKGKSAIAKAAYNARTQLFDERKGEYTRDYGKPNSKDRGAEDVLFSGIFVDPSFKPPDWVQDREKLWNAAVAAEKKSNALEAQEIILNLPNDLSLQAHKRMVTDFVRENLTRRTGRVVDVNIHDAPKHGDDRNVHVHLLLAMRKIGPNGFGERLPELDRDKVISLREKWAERGARELRREGFEKEADRWAVGHQTLKVQRSEALKRGDMEYAETLNRQPQIHEGPNVRAMERNGIRTDKGNHNREVRKQNRQQELARKRARGIGGRVGNVVAGVAAKPLDIISSLFEGRQLTPQEVRQGEAAQRLREAVGDDAIQRRQDEAELEKGRSRER